MSLHSGKPPLRSMCLAAFILLLARPWPVAAQVVDAVQWTTHRIESKVLGETRIVRIAVPLGHDLPQMATTRYPVVFVLDADGDFGFSHFVINARGLGSNSTVPPMIVVGIQNLSGATRFRDFTLPSVEGSPARSDGGGGAMAFLDFLRTEVRPFVDTSYRTEPFNLIWGHSLGGFFARWAFGQAPNFINAAIASSPSILEQGRVLDVIAARRRPGRLIMLSGTSEIGLDREARSFAAALQTRNLPGLEFEHQRIADAAHLTTQILGVVPSLRFIFRPVSLGGYQVEFDNFNDGARVLATFSAAFDGARAAYLRGAAELGLSERLPFSFLTSQAGNYQGGASTAPLLLRICQEMFVSYPSVWHGFECAGDALMRMGQSAEGAGHYDRALEAARRVGDRVTIDRLVQKAAKR